MFTQIPNSEFSFIKQYGEKYSYGSAYLDLYFLANHEDGMVLVKNKTRIPVPRGSIGLSMSTIAERRGRNRRTVKKYLEDLQKAKKVHIETHACGKHIIRLLCYIRAPGLPPKHTPGPTPGPTPYTINNTGESNIHIQQEKTLATYERFVELFGKEVVETKKSLRIGLMMIASIMQSGYPEPKTQGELFALYELFYSKTMAKFGSNPAESGPRRLALKPLIAEYNTYCKNNKVIKYEALLDKFFRSNKQ